MSLYYIMKADEPGRGEIVRDGITSEQLAQANRLLEASKRLQSVSDRANSRERSIRYGDAYQHPYGVVKPQFPKRRTSKKHPRRISRQAPGPMTMKGALLDLGKGFCGAVWTVLAK